MKPTKYSEKVLDHFRNPRNVGTLEGDDVGTGRVGNPVCGDLMEFYVKVKDGKIDDIKYKTFGCGSAIATASMISEMAVGKSLDDALEISRQDVADELDGLPPAKMHCSNLAADALSDAINNYRESHGETAGAAPKKKAPQKKIIGADAFLGRGFYRGIDDPGGFADSRVLILDTGAKSIEAALELTEHTQRVVLATPGKTLDASPELKTRLKQSDVKVLYESELLDIMGADEVEKVLIHDLNEDEEYELFTDAVIVL